MRVVDLHCHLMPGVDDGATDLEESRRALLATRAAGVVAFAATPHLLASLTADADALEARLSRFDAAWEQLSALVAAEFEGMTAQRGVELMLDAVECDLSDPRLRLGGGSFLLLEFPFMSVPPRSVSAIRRVREAGVVPIIAHPERYAGLASRPELALEWRRAGAYLQVNAPSLLGRYGKRARELALSFLRRGWVDYLASDFHARGAPGLMEAARQIGGGQAEEVLRLCLETNPARVLQDQPPLPVPPLRSGGVLARLADLFR